MNKQNFFKLEPPQFTPTNYNPLTKLTHFYSTSPLLPPEETSEPLTAPPTSSILRSRWFSNKPRFIDKAPLSVSKPVTSCIRVIPPQLVSQYVTTSRPGPTYEDPLSQEGRRVESALDHPADKRIPNIDASGHRNPAETSSKGWAPSACECETRAQSPLREPSTRRGE